jgi:hypothetical protein
LTSLPQLNKNLQMLECNNNKLISLPELNEKLEYLDSTINNLPNILNNYDFISEEIRTNVNQFINNVNKCKYRIMCFKYRNHFRRFYFDKVLRPKIEKHYHPSNLNKILDSLGEHCNEEELDKAIESW